MRPVVFVAALAFGAAASSAWAGRPLATDDAATADARSCQLESWLERAGADRALVLAPACGLVAGVELGAEFVRPRLRDEVRAEGGLALKWVPAAASLQTPAGAVDLGLKLATSHRRPVDGGWRRDGHAALALASLAPADGWTLHTNLGVQHDRDSGRNATLLNLALDWTPRDAALLFAEVQANDRRPLLGGAVRSAGARWWLLGDRFGIDLTASREAGASGPTRWSLGFGWYGLGV